MQFIIVQNSLGAGTAAYELASMSAQFKGLAALGLQLINNVVNGSPAEPVVPPVLTGLLRSSGSVFVGNKLIGTTPGQGTPSLTNSAPKNVVTVGFNTDYAAKMHEKLAPAGPLQPGPFSTQSGDVGGKFIEKHLAADADEIFGLYAKVFKKESGG